MRPPIHDLKRSLPNLCSQKLTFQVDLPNPPHISPQLLKGTSEEMSPSALKREDTLVETKLGTSIKTFQRTISDEVGNAGPEHCRTKKALVLSMRTIQAFLRYVTRNVATP